MPSIRIKLPGDQGEFTQILMGQRITIGRRADNTIQIIHPTVSGHHAELISTKGHYRLHDLGSTNLTCVDGHPITDFHLHTDCILSFGTIECEFSVESLKFDPHNPSEIVPTRAELEFLRSENFDLQAKLATQQKQIDILSNARLISKQTALLGVSPETHRHIVGQRDELRTENQSLKRYMENLKADLISMSRERDAMRHAWETVKNELAAARSHAAT